MKNVIAISGPAGSGKSTVADHLVMSHNFVLVKFAGPLKDMMRAIGFGRAEVEGHLKEKPHPWLGGQTPRHAMQTLGTEWGRHCIGPNFWVGIWSRTACDVLDHGGRVVVDDCRFGNEADEVHRIGGVVIRLTGRGGIAGGHESERFDWPADVEIANDNVALSELFRRVDQAIAA